MKSTLIALEGFQPPIKADEGREYDHNIVTWRANLLGFLSSPPPYSIAGKQQRKSQSLH